MYKTEDDGYESVENGDWPDQRPQEEEGAAAAVENGSQPDQRPQEEEGAAAAVENGNWPDQRPQEEEEATAAVENGGQPDQRPQEEEEATAAETAVPPLFLAIEEQAAAIKISAPVFAAVRQYKGWAAGKKVEKSEFERAVKDFLGSPIGGK